MRHCVWFIFLVLRMWTLDVVSRDQSVFASGWEDARAVGMLYADRLKCWFRVTEQRVGTLLG